MGEFKLDQTVRLREGSQVMTVADIYSGDRDVPRILCHWQAHIGDGGTCTLEDRYVWFASYDLVPVKRKRKS